MQAGEAAHAALHRNAQRDQAGDARCFVATALWGATDSRTRALRAWRDSWLLKRWWGRAAVACYYAASPWLVRLTAGTPRLRSAIDVVLSALVRRLIAEQE
ncbi:CFI-box-CTERM domain-containing protein [Methylibium rhizosphaerae]|uniref:CFI-box-CTERM domain-containing protein n=1 Tax=Methylibium rhizosphaerae TaxID=2570323 RepID=UPI003CCC70A8